MSESVTTVISEILPIEQPASLKRDANRYSNTFGLISGIDYKYDEYGFIDWRSMIPAKFLFVNEQKFSDAKKDIPESVEGLDDSEVIIKLGGIKWLARIRGYNSVSFSVESSSVDSAIVKCAIKWIPNCENMSECHYEEIASCNVKNGSEFSLKYVESIAANRAFVRCVRNALNVNIVGEDELSDRAKSSEKTEQSPAQVSVDPQSIFLRICKEKNMSLEQILDFCGENDPTIPVDSFRGQKNEDEFIKNLTPKTAKKLLKVLRKT